LFAQSHLPPPLGAVIAVRLPSLGSALIDPEKLRDYLLSPSHDRGRFKAAVFASMGYSRDDWQRFEADIRKLIEATDAEQVPSAAHGHKYVVAGTLEGPAGRPRRIRTVWIVRLGERVPRLITAYPEPQP